MYLPQKKTVFLSICLLAILFSSWILQADLLMGWDVSLGLHEAARLYAGGKYGTDFFEQSPPMFLYLYLPPIIITKLFNFNIIVVMRSYIFLLATLSLGGCFTIVKNIFNQNTSIAKLFFLAIAVVFFLLPLPFDFGQREHLLVILTLPYILMVSYRLAGNSVRFYPALYVGIFAGLGFAIKPFFLAAFVLVELYSMLFQRNVFAWWRIETLAILGVLIIYGATTIIYFPTYFTIMIPIARFFYYQGISQPFSLLVLNPLFIFCGCSALCYFIQFKNAAYKRLNTILISAGFGFALSYLLQGTVWYYHLYPAFSMAFLSFVLSYSLFITKKSKRIPTKFHPFISAVLGMLIFFYPSYYASLLYQQAVWYKEKITPLITFMHTHAYQQPIYVLSTGLIIQFPAVDYAGVSYPSRFGALFWLPGFLKQIKGDLTVEKREALIKIYDSLISVIAEELVTHKPVLVFVDIKKYLPHLNGMSVDLLATFLKNPEFKMAWENYTYLTTVEGGAFYKFAVYQLNNRVTHAT